MNIGIRTKLPSRKVHLFLVFVLSALVCSTSRVSAVADRDLILAEKWLSTLFDLHSELKKAEAEDRKELLRILLCKEVFLVWALYEGPFATKPASEFESRLLLTAKEAAQGMTDQHLDDPIGILQGYSETGHAKESLLERLKRKEMKLLNIPPEKLSDRVSYEKIVRAFKEWLAAR